MIVSFPAVLKAGDSIMQAAVISGAAPQLWRPVSVRTLSWRLLEVTRRWQHSSAQFTRRPVRTPGLSPERIGARMLSYSISLRGTGEGSISAAAVDVQSASVVDTLETSSQAKWAADAAEVASELPSQGDFTSLGLGGYSPVGLIQWALEYLHCNLHLPWWAAIIASTVVLRTLIFPLAVRVQANAVKLNNIRPEADSLMAKIKQYNQAGNKMMSAQQTAKLMALYQKHGCHPLKMLLMPAVQVPIFVSFFIAIRKMAAVPVESMKVGGLFWFTDLTVSDPFYILPGLGCLSFMAIIELGGDVGVTNPQTEKMKFFFRCMSILLIPVTASFPCGVFMYWLTASGFSMVQILLLKLPRFRSALGIPPLVKHPPSAKESEGKGLLASVKENYRSAVIVDEVKRKEAARTREYVKMLKNPQKIKLYDKPPHLRETK